MKTKFIIFQLLLCPIALLAQSQITSIDNIYIERQSEAQAKDVGLPNTYELKDVTIQDGDVLLFDVPGLGDYLIEKEIPVSAITLFIEEIPIPELPAYILDFEAGTVRFQYNEKFIHSANRQQLYRLKGTEIKELRLGIEVGKEFVLNYYPRATFYFDTIRNWKKWGLALIGLFVIFFALLIFRYKSMVKDNLESFIPIHTESDTKRKQEEKDLSNLASYSFSKSQLAFWTFTIISSFIYIWALTGDIQAINNTALILLGISAGTISVSNIIAGNEETNADSAKAKKNLQQNRTTSKSFLKDILSDTDGVSIHRFQALVFNIVFGIAFFKSVILDYTMPDFSETQLMLLGLSNGTYAFMKNSENMPEKKEEE